MFGLRKSSIDDPVGESKDRRAKMVHLLHRKGLLIVEKWSSLAIACGGVPSRAVS